MSVEIRKVGVVGCGTMGSGICEVVARSGFDVRFSEMSAETERAGRERIERSVGRAVKREKLSQSEADTLLGHLSSTTDLADLADCDLVFEAVPEKLELKRETFAALDRVLKPEAVLATNTSSLPVIDMAVATNRPDRVVGFHFFNPATVMKLVELVHTVATDEEVIESAQQFADGLGKVAVPCRDRAGFIANLLLFPYLNAATRMYDQGYATREDIDASMQLGCGHPMGPLSLLDLIGLDSAYEICEALWRQWRDYQDAPPPLLKQFVTAGYLGRKTGRGFYRYEAPESPKIVDARPEDDGNTASGYGTVGIVGTGVMASAIAEVIARAGGEVVLRGRSESTIDKAKTAVGTSLDRAVGKGKLEQTDADGVLERVTTTLDFEDLAECDLVVEAVTEDLDTKSSIFKKLDEATKPDAVLATTTSSLTVVDLAAVTSRPDKVIGLHFFNPATVMRLVEVIRTVATADEVEKRCIAWVRSLGKRPVRCRDRAGFIVNFLLFPYLNDAVHMHEEGYGAPADIDAAMKLGCGHPMGPFELMDIVGLDVTFAILDSLHEEFRERRYAPAPLLEHMVRAGYLGRKSGRGFYDYSS
ncbi:MAG: 3-hydroxyacyl-CoA dehydrogenase family protein [Actinobacteria bacterium]|nr:3-hydroxyacyl-CoA dehydrogenase family protein [Actinomycetota bacterium]